MTAIIGAGAFGTSLAISLAGNGPVTLWCRDAEHAAETRALRENRRRLPGAPLPDTVTVTADMADIAADGPCLLSVPTQKLRGLLADHRAVLAKRPLVACCKGIELSTGHSPTRVIGATVPSATAAILTGPSFAGDIAQGLPTALTLACADAPTGKRLQHALTTRNLRLYRTTDVTGAEQGGALKNVMAIACGAVMGAGLGESARAALMTRGFAEMTRMAVARGARAETLSGLSGFGDLTLTCTSPQSRNYRFGVSLGRQERFDPSVTVEGVATTHAVAAEANRLGVDMPVTRAILALIDGKLHVGEAIDMLLSRPLKEE
ncbi:NAD(P)H-dependent glycerol-3-phosphate dehydrogenase [Roseovarius sp. SYSU LYC5161]|uniref:NAD(P)H-dependent glycerol-3-phosphate dehydrogenase n=1 Tax=Roseovarius halophilus (ex Wu et al. 2025) TaxID=3376060 RepID=UPI0039995A6D